MISNATEWRMPKEEFLATLGLPEDADVYHVRFDGDVVEISAHPKAEFT